MLQWLPGADLSTRAEGVRLVKLALELYKDHVTRLQRDHVTIAVGEVDELSVAVVSHPNAKTAERIAGRLRKTGIAATGASGDDHAEVVLHKREPGARAIGVSNIGGPCSQCEKYFGNAADGFSNVYWDDAEWVR